ncbi:hypothetical protein YB2330_003072 [Saitoella coloradoensis]
MALPVRVPFSVPDADVSLMEIDGSPYDEDVEMDLVPDLTVLRATEATLQPVEHNVDFEYIGPDGVMEDSGFEFGGEGGMWGLQKVKAVDADVLRARDVDYQGIWWAHALISRESLRKTRLMTHQNYTNCPPPDPLLDPPDIPPGYSESNIFAHRSTTTTRVPTIAHFQLRHLLSPATSTAVYHAKGTQILRYNPHNPAAACRVVIDLLPAESTRIGTRPTTLAADAAVVATAGFYGEYAYTVENNSDEDVDQKDFTGFLTGSAHGIGNHVHISRSRSSESPTLVYASNDSSIRTIDTAQNVCLSAHSTPWRPNTSSTSPDARLRLVGGDSCDAVIIDAESGGIIANLKAHTDWIFTSAWSPSWYLATGSQDTTARLWDARNFSAPVATLPAQCGSVRTLDFGGANGTLLAVAESADFVTVWDTSKERMQVIDFFGEVAGIGFVESQGSERLWIGVSDESVGGLMEYEADLHRDLADLVI